MKIFRHLFFVLIAIMVLPQAQGHTALIPKKVLEHIHAAGSSTTLQVAVKSPRFRATLNRFKRRPVGINDSYGHEKVHPVLLSSVTARFIYVDKTPGGYYFNPYLSVPTPLRSWRGPPTA